MGLKEVKSGKEFKNELDEINCPGSFLKSQLQNFKDNLFEKLLDFQNKHEQKQRDYLIRFHQIIPSTRRGFSLYEFDFNYFDL